MVVVVRRETEILPLRPRWVVWGIILGWTFLANGALAQVPAPAPETPPAAVQPQPAAPPAAQPTPPASTPVSPLPPPPPAAQPQTQPAGKGGCGGGGPGKMTPNVNAKWVCEVATVTLPPVPAGKSMAFAFNIRNDGTEDLVINAKGG